MTPETTIMQCEGRHENEAGQVVLTLRFDHCGAEPFEHTCGEQSGLSFTQVGAKLYVRYEKVPIPDHADYIRAKDNDITPFLDAERLARRFMDGQAQRIMT